MFPIHYIIALAILLAVDPLLHPSAHGQVIQPTPQSVPGLQIWCDYQLSVCRTGTTRATSISGTGSNVGLWQDISGNNNDLTLVNAGVLTGSGVSFSATAAFNAALTLSTTNCAVYIVEQNSNVPTLFTGAATGFSDYGQNFYGRFNDYGSPSITRYGAAASPSTNQMMNTGKRQVWGFWNSGTTSTIFRDGNSFSGAFTATNTTLTGFMFGSLNRTGAFDYYAVGPWQDILVYQPAPTPSQNWMLLQVLAGNYPSVQPAPGQTVWLALGDSITWGAELSYLTQNWLNISCSVDGAFPVPLGFPGWTMQNLQSNVYYATSFLTPGTKNIVSVWANTNGVWGGNTAAQEYGYTVSECQQIKAIAAQQGITVKVGVITMLPRGSPALSGTSTWTTNEATRQSLNTLFKADSNVAISGTGAATRCYLAKTGGNGYCDFLLDAGSDPIIGGSAASQNATYYYNDQIHPIVAGHSIIAQYMQAIFSNL